ncbi:exosortase H [Pseudomonas sp. PDM16]|uniref:exosortase H n=1 Tax=Pseudomonas sp. PDM16 TaxID=2769292 RepID=UPI00177C65C1|nr:exosortase H [Pseudomonas sp. PDM16]MBD9415569.1 exosortase H [Pseudomonas sp. PDM16]
MVRFFVIFLLLVLGLFTVELTPPAQSTIVIPWTLFLAEISATLIGAFDSDVVAYGKVLQSLSRGGGVSIEAGCNGIEACILLTAAVLAYSAPWRHKLVGLLLGFFAIQALNVLRVISLYYLALWHRPAFEFAHLYVWQILIMLDVLVVWLIWIQRLPRPKVADASAN